MILNLWLLIFVQRLIPAVLACQASVVDQIKIHKYRDLDRGIDFVIEPFQDKTSYVMTSQRFGLKPGDYVVIQGQSENQQYRILEINYYGESAPDLWIAQLLPISALISFAH